MGQGKQVGIMASSQFYLTLPSNSNEENSASVFTTNLPQNIEIIDPNSWFNITDNDNLIEFFDAGKQVKHKIKILWGRYETADELIDVLNSAIRFSTNREKATYEDYFNFSYVKQKKTINMYLNTALIKNVKISRNITYMLGFREQDFTYIDYTTPATIDLQAYNTAVVSCAMNYLYLYCDVLEPQVIDTKLAPILQVVNVEWKYTELVSRIYTSPHYVPILKKCFNSIDINIKNDQDLPVNFTFGKTIVKFIFEK